MSKRFINFGSIDQFRNIIRNVQHMTQYTGQDENGEPIYDRSAKSPTIKVVGSEKIHGTNAAVCYSHPDGMWVQSRKNIITPEKDNAGCAFAVESNSIEWMKIIDGLINEYGIDCHKNIISVYFEWCGGNIQKNACVSGLDKMAIIFRHFKVSPIEPQTSDDGEEIAAKWYETNTDHSDVGPDWVSNKEKNIYNVMDFPTVTLEIDFERADIAQNEMVKLTEEIETNSGIAKAFNKPENVGEGWVWTFVDKRGGLQRFKTKGEKHAKSKVKTLKKVDSVKEQAKVDFANYATPAWRLEQAWQTVFGINNEIKEPDIKFTGEFLKAVVNDVMKEELDVMAEKGLEPKEVNGMISKVARRWFMDELDKGIGL